MAVIEQLVKGKGLDAETREMVFETLKEYAGRNLTPKVLAELDEKNEFPVDIMKDLYDEEKVGIHLMLLPEQYGGLGGNTYDIARACEILAGIDLGVATSVFATFLGLDPIMVGGTQEQKDKWLTKAAKEGLLVAYGATEADAGSDLLHLATRADRVMDGETIKGYKITGSKMWITNGGVAGLYTILAKTKKGVSWFIVEKGTEGLVADKHEDKHGIRISNTTPLSLNEVYVPAENLVGGEEGKGMRQAQAVFGYTRLMVASLGLGTGWESVKHAIRYSQMRKVRGGLLKEMQGYNHKFIVPFAARLEACRSFIEECAARLDGGEAGLQVEGAIAKYLTTETANLAADAAIQSLGGNGYSKEFPVERLKRDIKITCIYEGTSEILQMTTYGKRWLENVNGELKVYDKLAEEMDALHAKDGQVGADAAAVACRALSKTLKSCYDQKITTENQAVTFKLGELFAWTEVALAFCRGAAKDQYSEGVAFDRDTWRAMARIYARQAASHVSAEGIKVVCGYGDAPDFAQSMDLGKLSAVLKGDKADMDLVAGKLVEVYKAEG